MDRCNDPSALSGLATSSSIWHPQKFDRLENHWARDSSSGARPQENGAAVPLVIQNPVNSRKLEEPIERKREYWSENLLYIMRREGLIPKNCPVVMDRPTPEEPYRLSANVVRLLEQEPDLYIAKSSIKIPSFDSEPSERSREESSSSIESWDQKPFSFSRAAVERPESFKDSIYRPSNTCCGCSCNTAPTSTAAGDSVPKSHNLFSSLLELHSQNPLYAQSRNYSTTVASKPAQKKSSQLIVDWDPVNHLVVPNKYVGSDEASLAIINMWRSKRQKKRTYENKLKMKQHLESNLFRGYRFLITGSSANGYGFDDSDVDMLIEAKNDLIPANDPISMLKGLRTHMYGVDCFQRPVLIKAICPILKFRYKRYTHDKAIQVEINANPNRVGFLNTQLLYAYSRMDPRVAPLVGACKQWGDTLNVKNAQRGTLSSYSITLMAIYFLQTVSVVPVLHNFVPEFAKGVGFREKQKLMLPYWSSTNAQNLGTLFRDMLKFYSDFDFKNYCISVKTGDALPIQDAIEMDPDLLFEAKNRSLSSRETWGFINIQEPFNLTNTARSLHGERPFGAIKRAFQRSNEIVLEKGGVNFLLGALTANTK